MVQMPMLEAQPSALSFSKPCSKRRCGGTMLWTPNFRNLSTKSVLLYRPAWVCDACKRHDYVRGVLKASEAKPVPIHSESREIRAVLFLMVLSALRDTEGFAGKGLPDSQETLFRHSA